MYIILRTRILVMLHGYNSFHLKRKKNSMLPSYKPKNEKKKKKSIFKSDLHNVFRESPKTRGIFCTV